MSDSPAVEIDFFRLKEESSPKKLSTRRNIQDMFSKINPEAVASAIANTGLVANKSYTSTPQLPVYSHQSGGVNMASSAPPLTIIYNGTVSVFDVSPDKADNIMKLAEKVNSAAKSVAEPTVAVKVESDQSPVIDGAVLTKDLPMSRKKSLKRFLEKRKERQVSVSPYASLH